MWAFFLDRAFRMLIGWAGKLDQMADASRSVPSLALAFVKANDVRANDIRANDVRAKTSKQMT